MPRRQAAAAGADPPEGEAPKGRRRGGSGGGDSAPPERPKVTLTPFEGHDVRRSSVAITNAGDGLSKAMGVEPVELHHGQRVMVVLDCIVQKIRHDPIEDTDDLQRVHILKAGTATFIDAPAVRDALDSMQRRIEEHAGILHLPLGQGPADGEGDGDKSPEEWEKDYPQGQTGDELDGEGTGDEDEPGGE